jgi:hypothetical protein
MVTGTFFGLTKVQEDEFKSIHEKHYKGMGLSTRKNYTLNHITNVDWDEAEKCYKVYYKDGEWWHYLPDGTWY